MSKINVRTITDSIFNIPNAVIFGLTVIVSAFYFKVSGSMFKPMFFGIILMFFSTMYSLLFGKQIKAETTETNEAELNRLANETQDNLTPIIRGLISLLKNLKGKSRDNLKFLFVSNFLDEIYNFEQMIPKLVNNYRKGSSFLKEKKYLVSNEIKNLEYKLIASIGIARTTYEKALEEKRQTLNEMQGIEDTLDEFESKLHYILSTLEKIETTVESSDLKDEVTDEEAQNINQQLEAFSDSIKDVVKLMKL